jgi:repressor LexA
MDALPPRQRELLDFVAAYTDQKGIPPTLREIGEALGIKSTNGVSDQVKALVKKGFIERVGDARTSRSIRVTHEARGGFRDASTMAVPVIGRVAAGSPILAEENYAGTLHMDASVMPHQAPVFALIIHGNSMIEDGILDGDYVFVRKQTECRNGDIMVAMVDGEATCKRFFRERGRVRLQPANSEMAPIYVDSTRDLQVLGVVVGVYRRILA